MSNPNRYELRRYRNGQKDPELRSAYSDRDWAVAIARDYGEPGAIIEVWDTVENCPVPLC